MAPVESGSKERFVTWSPGMPSRFFQDRSTNFGTLAPSLSASSAAVLRLTRTPIRSLRREARKSSPPLHKGRQGRISVRLPGALGLIEFVVCEKHWFVWPDMAIVRFPYEPIWQFGI